MEHVTITIRVHNDNGSYVVTANSLRSRKPASCVFHMPPERWQDLEPSLRVLKARSGELSLHEHEQEIRDFGISLFNSLIHGEVRVLYDEKKRDAFRNGKSLRLRLNILPPELVILPWEILCDERNSGYLCLERKPSIVIVRTIDHEASQRSLGERPLHILGMAVSPATLPPLDIEKEQHTIQEALQSLIAQQQVQLQWKPGRYTALEEIRSAAERYDVFHFAGHGIWDERSERGQLAVEGERRLPRYVPADHWHRFLQASTRLVVLNACETAFGNRFNSFSNIAYSLIKVGFPAVIAMQFKITDTASLRFSKAFYTSLARGESVDEAIMAAREAIYLANEETNPLDWAAPIFFSSSSTPIYLLPPNKLSRQQEPNDQNKVREQQELDDQNKPSEQQEPNDQSKVRERQKSDDQNKVGEPQKRGGPPVPPLIRRRFLIAAGLLFILLGSLLVLLMIPKPLMNLCLVTDLPLSDRPAGSYLVGANIENGVRSALNKSQLFGNYDGYHLIEVDMNDNLNPTKGVQNLQQRLPSSQKCRVVAVIGPYDSPTAAAEIPVAAKMNLLLLSPSNTAPCLTDSDYNDPQHGCAYSQIHPSNLANTYARLTPTDVDQGSVDADFLASLGAKRIEVVEDEELYGVELAQSVMNRLQLYGLKPIGIDCVTNNHSCSFNSSAEAFSTNNLDALATKIRDEQADAVFFSGRPEQDAGLLRQELVHLGLDHIPFVGGSALIADKDVFLNEIGSDVKNVYATFPTMVDPSAISKTLRNTYSSLFGSQEFPGYSANGFDAANIVITVIKMLIDNRQSVTSGNVVQNVLGHDFMGVAGNQIRFNQNGDNMGTQVYSLYTVQDQQGTPSWSFRNSYPIS